MKSNTEVYSQEVFALSFDKLLSVSNALREGTKYGQHCCLVDVNTDTDRNIFKYPVRIDAYIFVVCSGGLIELTYNQYAVTLSTNHMFLYNPGTIIQINAQQPSKLNIMIFTHKFIDELGIKLDNMPLQYRIARERQTFLLSEQGCCQLRALMMITREFICMDKTNTHYPEMVKSTFKSFIYRAIYAMNEQYDIHSAKVLSAQDNNHFDKFMRLLETYYKSEHSIKFYSDKIGLSPKYLSILIKRISGKFATEWIDEYVILEAKNLLKYSPMSVQEISYSLNFPNQSFFGKYFKRHTGLSPKAYRVLT